MRPAIVWRNPDPQWHKKRWLALERTLNSTLYVIQELVRTGDTGQWVTVFAFEVARGGRIPAAGQTLKLAHCVSK